jgi:LacI family transcriptional regulator
VVGVKAELRIGRMNGTATIKDVARSAGVSLGTVSNVLNRPELVAESTRVRVLDAVETLGYVRNASASQLRSGKGVGIGVIVLDVANPFFTEVARGIEDEARKAGFLITLCSSDGSTDREAQYLHLLEEQRIGGVLITTAERKVPPAVAQLRARGTPVVLLDASAGARGHCVAAVDDVYGGRIAAEHLLELGHHKLAIVNGPLELSQCAARRRGFLAAARKGDADSDEINVDAMTTEAGEEAVAQLLAKPRKVSAIFCANDMLALGALKTLLGAGLRVPEDVALVGYDDVSFAALAQVPLSSIRQPTYDLGRTAAQLLLEEINDGRHHRHRSVVFKPELVARASTGPCRASRRPVAS